MSRKTSLPPISRRRFVGGTLASGALAGSAVLMGLGNPVTASAGITGRKCRHQHVAMAQALSQTIADPSIGAEATARAIRTSFCPCCGTQIGAATRFEASGVAA